MVEAAIFVILMEEVLEARIVSGPRVAASSAKIACLSVRFSDTACKACYWI